MRSLGFVGLVAAAGLAGAAAHAADGPVIMTLASVAPDGSPWAVGLQEFKQIAETESERKRERGSAHSAMCFYARRL